MIQRFTCNMEILDECPHIEPLLKDAEGGYVRYADHAAELARWKQRAERAEAYTVSQNKNIEILRLSGEYELARVEAANALLRAECEAWRKWFDAESSIELDEPLLYQAAVNARAATDAAGILKGEGQ